MIASRGGYSAKSAARMFGRAVGRASGSLRRVRAEVERIQARAEALGGSELATGREDLVKKLSTLRNIQAEASSLLTFNQYPYGPTRGGMMSSMGFTDDELAAALRAEFKGSTGSTEEAGHAVTNVSVTPAATGGNTVLSTVASTYQASAPRAGISDIPQTTGAYMHASPASPPMSFNSMYPSAAPGAGSPQSGAQLEHPFLPPKLSTIASKANPYTPIPSSAKPKVKYHTPEGVPVVEAAVLKVWQHRSSVHNDPAAQPKRGSGDKTMTEVGPFARDEGADKSK